MIPRKWWQSSRAYREGGDSEGGGSNYSNEGRNYSQPSLASQYSGYGSGRQAAESSGGYGYGNEEGGWRSSGGSVVESAPAESPASTPTGQASAAASGAASNNNADSYGGETRPAEQRQSEEAPKSLAYRLGIRAPGTTAAQMFDSETVAEKTDRLQLVDGIIGKAVDAVVPWQFSLLKNGVMAASDVANGASLADAGGRVVPGIINRFAVPAINKATGGAMTAFNLGNAASAALGGPSVKSIGDAAWSAVGGGQPPGQQTVNNPDTGRPYLYPDSTPVTTEIGGRSSSSGGQQPEPQAAPASQAAPAAASPDIDANLFGNLNESGWRSASSKYAQSRKKGLT